MAEQMVAQQNDAAVLVLHHLVVVHASSRSLSSPISTEHAAHAVAGRDVDEVVLHNRRRNHRHLAGPRCSTSPCRLGGLKPTTWSGSNCTHSGPASRRRRRSTSNGRRWSRPSICHRSLPVFLSSATIAPSSPPGVQMTRPRTPAATPSNPRSEPCRRGLPSPRPHHLADALRRR